MDAAGSSAMPHSPFRRPRPEHGLFDLAGQLAVVTGAARGIGREAARALAQHGARVILVDKQKDELRDAVEQLSAEGYESHGVPCDLTDQDAIRQIHDAARPFGAVGILVNAAGAVRRTEITEATVEDLDWLWAINVRSTFALTQELLADMIEFGHGKVINLGSLGSVTGLDRRTAYAITKGAVAQYTVSLAREVARYGIRVNAIAPGYVDTTMTSDWLWGDEQRTRKLLDRIPLGYFAEPHELAGVFVFLASAASDYMTGQLLVVDGGWTTD
ncbi:SDR family NAD(P)-dependent oxidoreductase [Saccharopolyspora hattusasensis]|uniref:SDR family NAD(P)-dependent oxidoreductase n=1 Tax=Saccharopolyspora hattusasensis TaxID=1128679 RepID=UPI003D981822